MKETLAGYRQVEYPISTLLLNRWSPRAMSGAVVSKDDLFPLFEAARWAPSSFNNQPWRFIYAQRGSAAWYTFFNLLVEANRLWAKNAGALILIISKKT